MHAHVFSVQAVVDGKGEAFGQATVIGEHQTMNPCVDQQGVNVGKEAVEEISAKTRFSCFVELKAVNEVVLGFIQDLDSQDSRFRMSALAVSQSENLDCP